MINTKYVIVGSGFAGSVLARKLAEAGRSVLVLERRDVVSGNMFDKVNENNICVQKYGPHTFHTNDSVAYNFLCRYSDMMPYTLTYQAIIKGVPVPCPFNFNSIRHLYSSIEADALIHRLKENFPNQEHVAIFELLESHDPIIRDYAEMLFEEDFRPYTAKQWGKDPDEIDQSIIRRVPIWLNEKNTYFDDTYECYPSGGYYNMFLKILDHPNIQVVTSYDALQSIRFDETRNVVLFDNEVPERLIYTGAIDELFGHKFGSLPYRSLYFEYEALAQRSFQQTAIVAHPKDAAFTRITEYTKIPLQDVGENTVIVKEYSIPYEKSSGKGNEPYYPIINEENIALYQQYSNYSNRYHNLILCGRLADYKYYNMDQVILRALEVFEELKNEELKNC